MYLVPVTQPGTLWHSIRREALHRHHVEISVHGRIIREFGSCGKTVVTSALVKTPFRLG
jgi:hypothetical protein